MNWNRTQLRLPVSKDAVPVLLMAIFALVITIIASFSAIKSRNNAFPSLFIDPYGVFSAVSLPSWNFVRPECIQERKKEGREECTKTDTANNKEKEREISHPDRIVSINGKEMSASGRPGKLLIREFFREIEMISQGGNSNAVLEFSGDGINTKKTLPIRVIEKPEIGYFFIVYLIVAWIFLWSGLLVFHFARHQPGARAYAFTTFCAFMFFATFLDYHTQSLARPIFTLGVIGQTIGFVWMTIAFPFLPKSGSRLSRYFLAIFAAFGFVTAVIIIIGPYIELDTITFRIIFFDHLFNYALFILGISIFVRLIFSHGQVRQQLKSTALGFLFVPIVFCVLAIFNMISFGAIAFHMILPFAPLLITISIGNSIIKYNILNMGVVLNKKVFLLPVVFVSLLLSVYLFLPVQRLSENPSAHFYLTGILSLFVCYVLGVFCYKYISRYYFPAAAAFRPTVEVLTERLSLWTDQNDIRNELIDLVKKWLPVSSVDVVLEDQIHDVLAQGNMSQNQVVTSDPFWIHQKDGTKSFFHPMISSSTLLGGLLLAPKGSNALYTEEDLSLLLTIASLGAVALHNSRLIENINMLKRLEVDISHKDRQMSINALSAEIAHEIIYPLNFFRYMLKELRNTHRIEDQDIEIGQEEVERLERMLDGLRRMKPPEFASSTISVNPCINRAISLLHDEANKKKPIIEKNISEGLKVEANADLLLQLFSNLLRNSMQAIKKGGRISIQFAADDIVSYLDFIDDGVGFIDEGIDIFAPLVTTKEEGSGLGLVVCQRIVRTFGWRIQAMRVDSNTCFRIEIPNTSIKST